ncbi:relaxin-3 receptor 1 [Hoplias malabaricus]|uniref:relaxin-3 receptor 1 n=1 Tax=Hoplias malabaricus TaxID=27720 RepID=UPI003461C561
MSFLRQVAGHTLCDRVRSSVTREELGVESLLLRVERSQLKWFRHLMRMPPGRLPLEVHQARPTGRKPRGRPRTRWRDYISRLAWEHLGIPQEELVEYLVLLEGLALQTLFDGMADSVGNQSTLNLSHFSHVEDIEVIADGAPAIRLLISIVYSFVCATGLLGNILVFYLMRSRHGKKRSSVNFFILNLAVTDFQFVLALPFWAVEAARDFSWPFGHIMCKVVLTVTVMNCYASVFFLTAMSVTRYWAVASALRERTRRLRCSAKHVSAFLWLLATVATAPTVGFAAQKTVFNETLCLISLPNRMWLSMYHLQRIVVGFLVPLLIVCVCYLLLLRLVRLRSMNNNLPKRRSKVTKSVTIVVLSFFLCWMPNHAITFWSVLVKLDLANFGQAFYVCQTYVFPVTICLANANSCLNPVLYCLTRRDFRKMLKDLFWRISSPAAVNGCRVRPLSSTKGEPDDSQAAIPLHVIDTEHCRLSGLNGQCGSSRLITRSGA